MNESITGAIRETILIASTAEMCETTFPLAVVRLHPNQPPPLPCAVA